MSSHPPELVPYVPVPGTPPAFLLDLDGTAALLNGRSPYDESRVRYDLPNMPVITVARALCWAGLIPVVMSGRTEKCREDSTWWLTGHLRVPFAGPFMRAAGDTRRDSVVKAELFDLHVRHAYTVVCVLDDRNQVVEMWRALNLTCLQVAPGGF